MIFIEIIEILRKMNVAINNRKPFKFKRQNTITNKRLGV